jgi:hypothetical protein
MSCLSDSAPRLPAAPGRARPGPGPSDCPSGSAWAIQVHCQEVGCRPIPASRRTARPGSGHILGFNCQCPKRSPGIIPQSAFSATRPNSEVRRPQCLTSRGLEPCHHDRNHWTVFSVTLQLEFSAHSVQRARRADSAAATERLRVGMTHRSVPNRMRRRNAFPIPALIVSPTPSGSADSRLHRGLLATEWQRPTQKFRLGLVVTKCPPVSQDQPVHHELAVGRGRPVTKASDPRRLGCLCESLSSSCSAVIGSATVRH